MFRLERRGDCAVIMAQGHNESLFRLFFRILAVNIRPRAAGNSSGTINSGGSTHSLCGWFSITGKHRMILYTQSQVFPALMDRSETEPAVNPDFRHDLGCHCKEQQPLRSQGRSVAERLRRRGNIRIQTRSVVILVQ